MERRTERITIRLTPSEASRIVTLSEKLCISPSEYIRKRTLGRKLVVREYQAPSFQVINELKALGNNLNQIARKFNENRTVSPARLDHLLEKIEAVVMKAVDNHDRSH